MGLTDIGIVAIDVVFVVALVLAASCLAYLVYATVREHAELSPASRQSAGFAAPARRVARTRLVTSLRLSTVHHRATPSS